MVGKHIAQAVAKGGSLGGLFEGFQGLQGVLHNDMGGLRPPQPPPRGHCAPDPRFKSPFLKKALKGLEEGLRPPLDPPLF